MLMEHKRVLIYSAGLDTGGVASALRPILEMLEQHGFAVKVAVPYESDIAKAAIPARYIAGAVRNRRVKTIILIRLLNLFNLITGWRFYFWGAKRFEHDILIVFQALSNAHWWRYSDKPTIGWLHGMPSARSVGWRDKLWTRAFTRNYGRFQRLIAVSEEVAAVWQARYGLPRKPEIIENLMDVDGIVAKSNEVCNLSSEATGSVGKQLVCVARLAPEKGIIRLLNVAKRLRDDGRQFQLTLVGDGPLRTPCRAYIEQYGLEKMVQLVGMQANPYPYMKAADLLVCPSHEEGLGLVLREALICGTPVLSTDCGGTRSAVRNGEWGYLVANTEEALYAGLCDYLGGKIECRPKCGFDKVSKELHDLNVSSSKTIVKLIG